MGRSFNRQQAVQFVPNDSGLHFTLGLQFEARGATTAYGGYGFDRCKGKLTAPGPALTKAARADYESALEQYRLAHHLAPNNSSYKEAYERVSGLLRRP